MTDQDRFFALLAAFDVEPTIETTDDGMEYVLRAGQGGVRGSGSVDCAFRFDGNGKFRDVTLWE